MILMTKYVILLRPVSACDSDLASSIRQSVAAGIANRCIPYSVSLLVGIQINSIKDECGVYTRRGEDKISRGYGVKKTSLKRTFKDDFFLEANLHLGLLPEKKKEIPRKKIIIGFKFLRRLRQKYVIIER
ncbi:hypothetical protein ISN45_At04g007900 [Arabidopsis thaliana x Arabidopsis arenosa]|uniref:Uncharacterized protein n=1 Tax=Arabidopsis thaliana x Arabidopsis arenosa TaxID=1240361 RepID=A0A8T2DVJ9_9BRAS|nr:hypothetical protein ISN45_At04g007900 [Arabidopsis thaliana x Arabidopsis arenosa]